MPDNISTKISKLINLGNENLAQKGITTTQSTMREVVDSIADIQVGISDEQLEQWAAANTQLEEAVGIYEPEIVPTSAVYFTFDGNACTGYTGDNTLPEIIIPRSYSTISTVETVVGAKVLNKHEIRYIMGNFNSVTFSDGENNTHIYWSHAELGMLESDFPNDCYLVLMDVISNVYEFDFLNRAYDMQILQFPININGQSFSDGMTAFDYIIQNNITDVNFGGDIKVISYVDGNDYQVTTIGAGADGIVSDLFAGTVRLLDNIININSYAFYYASNLTKIIVGKNVASIGDYAFHRCTKLNTIVFEEPSQLTSIGAEVFRFCNNLTNILIPSSVTSIDGTAFRDPTGFTIINVNENNQLYSSENGILFNKDKTSLLRYPDKKEDVSYSIPEGVKVLGTNAFSGCDNLVTITIPISMTSTEMYVFANSNIVNVYYSGTLSSWVNIDFPYYTSNPLCANRGMTENNLYIGNNKVTEIKSTDFGNMTAIKDNIFAGYNGLVSVEIPNTITNIGSGAFEYCKGLTSIVIPNSVSSIGQWAFSGCDALATVRIEATTPPTIQSTTFDDTVQRYEVPAESVEAYKTATNWSKYASRIYPIEE